MVSSAYLRLLIFLLAILIPAHASSSPAFLMMYSAYKLNKQGDSVQSWHTPFHTVKGFGIINKAKVDVFLELSCFFHDPMDVGSLISGSFAFSKSNLNIWRFTVRVLSKPGLENFEHYFASVWDECNCAIVWAFFGIAFLWDWDENWPFPVLWPLLSFQNLLACRVQLFKSISFRIWNSSAEIPSPPPTLFVVMVPKAHLTLYSRMSGSRCMITLLWLSGSLRSFLYSSSVYFCYLFLSFAFVRSIPFLSFMMVIWELISFIS